VEAFPDSTIEEKELVAEDDWVLCRTMTEGTHEGEFMRLNPTGEEVVMQRHESYRIEDGDFVEVHGTGSLAWVLARLGVDLPTED
jgi:predicted ester cyclase